MGKMFGAFLRWDDLKSCLLLLWWTERNFPTMGYLLLASQVSLLVCNRTTLLNVCWVVNAEVNVPVTAASSLYGRFQNPWNTFKHMCVSSFKDSFWAVNHLTLREVLPGWQWNKLDKKRTTHPQPTAGETKMGDGKKRGQWSIFILSPGFVNASGQPGEEGMSWGGSSLGVIRGIENNKLPDKTR